MKVTLDRNGEDAMSWRVHVDEELVGFVQLCGARGPNRWVGKTLTGESLTLFDSTAIESASRLAEQWMVTVDGPL